MQGGWWGRKVSNGLNLNPGVGRWLGHAMCDGDLIAGLFGRGILRVRGSARIARGQRRVRERICGRVRRARIKGANCGLL